METILRIQRWPWHHSYEQHVYIGKRHGFIYGDKPIRWPSQAVPLELFLVLYYMELFVYSYRHLVNSLRPVTVILSNGYLAFCCLVTKWIDICYQIRWSDDELITTKIAPLYLRLHLNANITFCRKISNGVHNEYYIDGLVQDCSIIAKALEILH